MVQITLLEVDLADAEFNAPFARARGDEGGSPLGGEGMGGLGRVIGEMSRSGGREAGEETRDAGSEEVEGESPGRGVAMLGAFFTLLVVGWLARRARRRRSTEDRLIEAS